MKDTYILGQHESHLTDWITIYSVTFSITFHPHSMQHADPVYCQ